MTNESYGIDIAAVRRQVKQSPRIWLGQAAGDAPLGGSAEGATGGGHV